MSDEECECEECPEVGAPAWMATFADLMSLLMCFFVLLLSFSEMDMQKYKQVAGSMNDAFGVQDKIKAPDVPKGTSIIAREFSPGRPEPTPIKIINQKTLNDFKQTLEFVRADVRKDVSRLSKYLVSELEREIEKGLLDLVIENNAVKIRIREKDSFPSGSANLRKSFYQILDKIATVLEDTDGHIIVAGHTDNVPISTSYYPSNWVLSSARAANVVHHLSERESIDPTRIEIRAYADTQPVAENDSAENRAKNRRVEVVISFKDKADNLSSEQPDLTETDNGPDANSEPLDANATTAMAEKPPMDSSTMPMSPSTATENPDTATEETKP